MLKTFILYYFLSKDGHLKINEYTSIVGKCGKMFAKIFSTIS